jgi:hypothetical protein
MNIFAVDFPLNFETLMTQKHRSTAQAGEMENQSTEGGKMMQM